MGQVEAQWASVLGGYKNLAKGNYATAMGKNAIANQNLCMAIGLQLNTDKFVRANQIGDWVLRAELIELRVGAGVDNTLVLTKLEELEDLVEYQEVEIDELEGDIQDFYRNLQEANEELFEINSD